MRLIHAIPGKYQPVIAGIVLKSLYNNGAEPACNRRPPLATQRNWGSMMVDETVDVPVFVYKWTNVLDGKQYIGITIRPPRRKQEHLKAAKNPKAKGLLHRAIHAHGAENFTFEIIYEAVNVIEAMAVERSMVAAYGTMYPNGYNLSNGGEGSVGRRLLAETKKLISDAAKAQWADPVKRARAMDAFKDRVISIEHAEHLRRQAAQMKGIPRKRESVEKGRAKLMGHVVSDNTKRKISISGKGKHAWTPEHKARHGAMMREKWASGTYANRNVGHADAVTRKLVSGEES